MTERDGDVHNMTMVSCSSPSAEITGYIVLRTQVQKLEARVLEYYIAKKQRDVCDVELHVFAQAPTTRRHRNALPHEQYEVAASRN
jgi:hypothetical protein